MVTIEVEGAVGEEPLEHLDGLDHPVDPDPGPVVGHARLVVIGLEPARPQAELEAAVAEEVEGGRLLGQHHRVAIVVAPDQGPQLEPVRGVGRRHQGHRRVELVVEVVGQGHRAVAQVVDPGDQVSPLPP